MSAVLEAAKGHACPKCGVFVPEERTLLTLEKVCIKCHIPKPTVVGVYSTFGGGNERVRGVIRWI